LNGLDPDKEKEANEFSENELVPKKVLSAFAQDKRLTKASIRKFAEELKISPGIIVGQLQHKQFLPRSHCNDLKQRFQWSAET
jgi:Zn-dependent peptidase ImmA (M78 family)